MWHVYDKVAESQENLVCLLGHFWTVHSLLQQKHGCTPPKALAKVSYSDKILIKVAGFTEAKDGPLK
ncbi:hypothetical protein MPLSOD_10063 [Mesorhizobium sp. SOD10]|nr:hypothetical protein MPLSOD_10063 [Mesorhizobium sp. SOD10]